MVDIFNWLSIEHTLITIPLGEGYNLSWIEAIATIFGLLCIWCASQAKTINFFFGLINVTLFAFIFYQIQLYALLMLQVFFFIANIYGWYAWTSPSKNTGEPLKIRWLSSSKQLITIAAITLVTILLTYNIDAFFQWLTNIVITVLNIIGIQQEAVTIAPNAYPFWDSAVAVISVIAQVLMTRKYVENWLLWVVVNIISVGLYIAQGVYVLALEYAILLFIAGNGARLWRKQADSTKLK